jgi:hypothetical protein
MFSFFVPMILYAQTKSDDSLALALVKRHILMNTAKMSMPGYRIQIYFGSARAKATEIKADIISKYPKLPAYLIYQQPNFKVRLGDFKTRFDAMHFLEEIQKDYPASFIVKDEVKLPDVDK